MRRIKGVRRVEKADDSWYGGWIARGHHGEELGGEGFRWRTRDVARTVANEADWLADLDERAEAAGA